MVTGEQDRAYARRMNPWGYITVGAAAAVLGGLFLSVGSWDGGSLFGLICALMTAAGLVLGFIGVIAEGVRVGNRAGD